MRLTDVPTQRHRNLLAGPGCLLCLHQLLCFRIQQDRIGTQLILQKSTEAARRPIQPAEGRAVKLVDFQL